MVSSIFYWEKFRSMIYLVVSNNS